MAESPHHSPAYSKEAVFQDPLIKILLLPFSLLYGLGISLRDLLYRWKLLVSVKFNLPVISVGNLSMGGAGKTPHIEYLIRLLGPYLHLSTLSRGYRRKTQGHRTVHYWSTVEEVGDEPLMYKRKYPEVYVTVNENRELGIPQLVQQAPQTQVVLLDDAFQHRSVTPGLNLLLTEFSRPFTRDFLLPSGRLREWRSAYRRADVVIVSKCPLNLTEAERVSMTKELKLFPHQQLFFSAYRYLPAYYLLNPKFKVELTDDLSVLAICAIANTDYLKAWLQPRIHQLRFKEFEDHHYFTEDDLEDIERHFSTMNGGKKIMLTTEKDAIRFEPHRAWFAEKQLPIIVLPIEVVFLGDDGPRFDQLVKNYLLDFVA